MGHKIQHLERKRIKEEAAEAIAAIRKQGQLFKKTIITKMK